MQFMTNYKLNYYSNKLRFYSTETTLKEDLTFLDVTKDVKTLPITSRIISVHIVLAFNKNPLLWSFLTAEFLRILEKEKLHENRCEQLEINVYVWKNHEKIVCVDTQHKIRLDNSYKAFMEINKELPDIFVNPRDKTLMASHCRNIIDMLLYASHNYQIEPVNDRNITVKNLANAIEKINTLCNENLIKDPQDNVIKKIKMKLHNIGLKNNINKCNINDYFINITFDALSKLIGSAKNVNSENPKDTKPKNVAIINKLMKKKPLEDLK
jgi:hypothetical protein